MSSNNEGANNANANNSGLSRNFSVSSSGTGFTYDTLKQYEKAALDSSRKRCDHTLTLPDLDYYREQHRAAMNQLEVSSQDSASLRTKYAELAANMHRLESENQRLREQLGEPDSMYLSHAQSTLNKLEQSQEENQRLKVQIELYKKEISSLRLQWQKILQTHEEDEKQLKALKIKAQKDLKRLADERNATMREINLIMSERDTVHKEMERLSDDLAQALKKNKLLDQDKKKLSDENKTLHYQAEGLKREIASALHERDKALKECGELRDKFGEPGDGRDLTQSRLMDSLNALGDGSTRKELQADQRTGQRQRLDNLDQANQELESLRKNLDKAQLELNEAIQEAEVSKGRRDWAFSERDKIVQERESIRTLCDNMRKERDRAVSELAESLRESDAVKKQKAELQKEFMVMKDMMENHVSPQNNWDEDVLEVELQADGVDIGVELAGGREDPGDGAVYVSSVTPNSPSDGKLRPNDRILRVNDVDCSSASRRMVLETIRSRISNTRVLIKRRKQWNSTPPTSVAASAQVGRWVHTARLAPACHGLSLKNGIYIGRISEGSLAAHDSTLAVGDRILKINDKSVEELGGIHEAIRCLNNDALDVVTITILKTGLADNNPNVFIPVRRYKKENRSSQTDDRRVMDMEQRRYQTTSMDYKNNGGAWLKEKLEDLVRGRHRHSKEDKKKYRNSSPNPLDGEGHEQAIAQLDLVIDSYHGTTKRQTHNRRHTASVGTKEEKNNGGTWPKARAAALLNPSTTTGIGGTVVARKKERPALSLMASKEGDHCCQIGASNRNSTPLPLSLLAAGRHTGSGYKSLDGGATLPGDSFEKLRNTPVPNPRLSINLNSDNSLDYPVSKYSDTQMAPPYYSRVRSGVNSSKYGSDSEREDLGLTGGGGHSRVPSHLFGGRIPFPFHPHPHPHHLDQSRESFSFEPPYSPASGDDVGGTFPRKTRDPSRFRVPSNPSVTGSVERGSSERGSPMPSYHVEVLSHGDGGRRDYCLGHHHKPLPGELRRVHIDKSHEPLGIQINCLQNGAIFVSTVSDNSLASRVGLQIGDQLLEVCGINMRNATYELAAKFLRQCGNSITMLVQYSPDKYNELEGDGSCSGDSSCNEDDAEGEATPCNSPKEVRKSIVSQAGLIRPHPNHPNNTLPNRQNNTLRSASGEDEPRYLYMETLKTSNLGISLVGGNAAGIFIHSVQPDSVAYRAGLRTGDQILDYNGSDLRSATAEEAAYELAKPADKVTVLAHYRIDRYHEIKDKPGDSLYVRCGFDRPGDDNTEPPQLAFSKDDVLYVDNTMFNGVPGQWRAWRLDADGHRQHCGVVPSKYKVEEELLLKRSAADLEGRSPSNTSSARRSFFRRKKHHQRGIGSSSNGSSRDSKELASFCSLAPGWYSEDLSLCSYQRVERLGRPEFRPVLVLGPLAECVVDKLVSDFPDQFQRVQVENRRCSQALLDRELADGLLVDYRRRGTQFECTTVHSVRTVCANRRHCMLDVAVSSVERLHRHNIYPVVLLVKFKSTKQIRELKDTRFSLDKLSGKAAKEMFEHGHKLEAEYRSLITAVVTAGANVAHVCAQVKAAVDLEHSRSQWVPSQ